MAVVVAPLLSLDASGMIGDTLEYKCGARVTSKKRSNPGKNNEDFNAQQLLFKEAVAAWNGLDPSVKRRWRDGGWWLPPAHIGHGVEVYINGYQCWMSYYLKFGLNGWESYPNPPPSYT
jgi:hypothetical protein